MNAPTGEVLDAFKRVAARPEGQAILGFLQQQREHMRDRLTMEQDATNLRQHQGAARVLDVLLKAWKP